MNIIELFENLNIDKTATLSFTSDEIIRIEKQVNVEKKINPEIDVNVASNLIVALRNYPKELHFIVTNRILYSLFSKKSFPIIDFPIQNSEVNNEQVRSFISQFLEEELVLYIDQKMSQNKYEDLNNILHVKQYFPEDVLYNLNKKAVGKIDFAITQLYQKPNETLSISYIKYRSFYDFLSHFRSIELDEKLKSVLNLIVDVYNRDKKSDFAGSTMISMSSYTAFDEDFEGVLKRNKDVVFSNKNTFSSSNSSSGFSWKTFGIILVVLLRIGFVASKCSNSSSDSYDSNSSNTYNNQVYEGIKDSQLDSYFVNMKTKIDSFHVFLTDFDKSQITQLKLNDSIITGQNPFENLYKNQHVSDSENPLIFKNTTKYDVILLENVTAYDTIKMPQQAYYIKAHESLKLDASNEFNRIYNFYIGSKLASFQTNSKHLFIRNHSIIEPRFSKLLPESKAILAQDYKLEGNVTIAQQDGKIKITSDLPKQKTLSDEVVTEEPPKIIEVKEK